MEQQIRSYFFGLVAFAFVACWATVGATTSLLALVACAVVVAGPGFARSRRKQRAPRPIRNTVRTRPLNLPTDSGLPLVPDEPSLIVELG